MEWAEEDQRLGKIISVPIDVYEKGCVQDVDDGLAVSIFTKGVVIKYMHLIIIFFSYIFPFKRL